MEKKRRMEERYISVCYLTEIGLWETYSKIMGGKKVQGRGIVVFPRSWNWPMREIIIFNYMGCFIISDNSWERGKK